MESKNYEKLSNGLEVVYAFGSAENLLDKTVLFLAGTTSWNSDLLKCSWRRKFLEKIGKEPNMKGVVICIPEPQFGVFTERYGRSLTDWENEYLNLATVHAFWLNKYWTYDQAISGTTEESAVFYADGNAANIGITVRNELGASFTRRKYEKTEFDLVVGAPHDAQCMEWLVTHSKILNILIHKLSDKKQVFDNVWYSDVLSKLI